MQSYQGGFSLRFSKTLGNLKSHRRWLERLVGDEFFARVKERFENKTRTARLTRQVQAIIEEAIYIPEADGQEYQRSYALLRSFIAAAGSHRSPSINVFSDLSSTRGNATRWNKDGSPLAVSGASQGKFSYAAFFEEPEKFKSFIPEESEPHRPFMDVLTEFVKDTLTVEAQDSILAEVKKGMPRST